MFESRRRQSDYTQARATIWMIALMVAVIVFLDKSPLKLAVDEEQASGVELTRDAKSDVVIVLDYHAISASPASFSEKDWSAAWINLMEQEIGPISISTPRTISGPQLSQAKILVLTASVAGQIPDEMRRRLRQFALGGGVLVVERPEGPLREMFSSDGRAGARKAGRVTFSDGLAAPYDRHLAAMPMSTEMIGSSGSREGAHTHLSIDGAPAIYSVPAGEGRVITVDFDLGEQLVSLQQGRPTESFRIAASRPDQPPKTAALIAAPAMRAAEVPWADLLERFIVWGVIARYAPVVAFWPFPADADGALIALHEDTELGDGGGWMLEHEATHNATSSLLTSVDSGLTAAGAAVIHRRGGEIGLAWRKADTPAEQVERIGAWGVEPFARPYSLEAQVDALLETSPVSHVHSSRTVGGWWDTRWDAPFRAMAARGIRVDTSYSAADTSGYAFGTGLPFLALGDDGLPLSIRELPVIFPADATEGPELDALMESSQTGHHQAIGWAVAPKTFADYPDVARFSAWQSVFERARQRRHVITSATRFDAFQRARRAGRIQTQLVRAPALSDAPDDPTPAPSGVSASAGARVLRITAESQSEGISAVVPEVLGGLRFHQARAGANRVAGELMAGEVDTRPARLVGYPLRRISLDQGFNTIDVFYR